MEPDHVFTIVVGGCLLLLAAAVLLMHSSIRRLADAVRDTWRIAEARSDQMHRQADAIHNLAAKLAAMGVPAEAIRRIAYPPDDTDSPLR